MLKLSVPYLSQTDNVINPYGACNVTSMAMGMQYYGIKKRGQQLEDEFYQYVENHGGSRHSPYDLAYYFEAFTKADGNACFDNFVIDGNVEKIKNHLDTNNPVVTHGYFTNFGHIIVIIGYDGNDFICHDPYGEWWDWGYDINDSSNPNKGESVRYSFDLMKRLCAPDGQWWCHFFSGSKPSPYAPLTEDEKDSLSGVTSVWDVLDMGIDLEFKIGAHLKNQFIKNVQICLSAHLNLEVKRDGVLGPETEGAYRKAMEAHGCREDRLGEREAKLLIQGKL